MGNGLSASYAVKDILRILTALLKIGLFIIPVLAIASSMMGLMDMDNMNIQPDMEGQFTGTLDINYDIRNPTAFAMSNYTIEVGINFYLKGSSPEDGTVIYPTSGPQSIGAIDPMNNNAGVITFTYDIPQAIQDGMVADQYDMGMVMNVGFDTGLSLARIELSVSMGGGQ